MNIRITGTVTEYTLEIEPTILRDGHIFVDGTWEQSRAYEVTGASVRVGPTGSPIVRLFGYELNTNDRHRRNRKNADPTPVMVPTLYIITYHDGDGHAGYYTSTFDSSAYDGLVERVVAALPLDPRDDEWHCDECDNVIVSNDMQSDQHAKWCSLHPDNDRTPEA